MKSNSPCLHPLQVVQEVLQVLADPQVPEYHLFQPGPGVLFLPIILGFFVIVQHHAVSHANLSIFLHVTVISMMLSSYRSTFLSCWAWWSLGARTSGKTRRSSWASRTTFARRTLRCSRTAIRSVIRINIKDIRVLTLNIRHIYLNRSDPVI